MSRNQTPLSLATTQASPAIEAWAPVAPYVPANPDHRNQRYFSRSGSTRAQPLSTGFSEGGLNSCRAKVFRFASDDTASLTVCARFPGGSSETEITGTAAELRTIAYMLLDAAHDLDTNPASQLVQVAA